MAMIVAIEGLIPDRRHSQTQSQPATSLPKPQIYVSEWRPGQKEQEAGGFEPGDVVAGSETQPITAEVLDQGPAPEPTAADRDQNAINTENGSWVTDAATGSISKPAQARTPETRPFWKRNKRRRR
jgi:hypothetical protein